MKIFKITALVITLFAFSLTRLSANPAIIAHVLREMGADFTLSHAEIETRFNNTKFADKLPKETKPEVTIIIAESLKKEATKKVRLAKSLCTDKDDLRYIEKYGRPFYCDAVVNFKINDLLTGIETAFWIRN